MEQNCLKAVFPYLNNITICERDHEEHDANLENFLAAAKRKNICYNDANSVFSNGRLAILGCVIEEGVIGPDLERLRPLSMIYQYGTTLFKITQQVSGAIFLLLTADP